MLRSIAAAILAVVPMAHADTLAVREGADPSPARPPFSLSLPQGELAMTVTAEIESSAGKLGEPVALAPDVAYGVTRDLTISVVHSRFAMTGFRAVTGGGFCLGDTCPQVYNNAGAEALYSLRRGSLAFAALGGLHALDFDRGFADAKLGVRVRWTHGRVNVLASPSVLVAMTEREDAMGLALNKDMLYVPVLASYQVVEPLAVGIGSGIKGPLADLGAGWEIPLGAVATYGLDSHVSIGASFVFGKLIGGADATGTDFRGTQVWVTVAP